MILPENGASMADAANTRENELPDICEDCGEDPEKCGYSPEECEEIYAQQAAEVAWEGARDAHD